MNGRRFRNIFFSNPPFFLRKQTWLQNAPAKIFLHLSRNTTTKSIYFFLTKDLFFSLFNQSTNRSFTKNKTFFLAWSLHQPHKILLFLRWLLDQILKKNVCLFLCHRRTINSTQKKKKTLEKIYPAKKPCQLKSSPGDQHSFLNEKNIQKSKQKKFFHFFLPHFCNL